MACAAPDIRQMLAARSTEKEDRQDFMMEVIITRLGADSNLCRNGNEIQKHCEIKILC